MKQKIILVDMDDTIENLLECWVKCLNEKFSTNVVLNDIIDWDINKFFPTLSNNEIFSPIINGDVWDYVKPKEGAVHYLKKLIDDGHKVYILTNTHYKCVEEKFDKVLFKYFPFIKPDQIIIAKDKQMVKGDYLIDDGFHNLVGGDYQGILVDMPHNRFFNEKEHSVIRVKTWEEIYEIISDN